MSKVQDLINMFDKNRKKKKSKSSDDVDSPMTVEKELNNLSKRKLDRKKSVKGKIQLFETRSVGKTKKKKKSDKCEDKKKNKKQKKSNTKVKGFLKKIVKTYDKDYSSSESSDDELTPEEKEKLKQGMIKKFSKK